MKNPIDGIRDQLEWMERMVRPLGPSALGHIVDQADRMEKAFRPLKDSIAEHRVQMEKFLGPIRDPLLGMGRGLAHVVEQQEQIDKWFRPMRDSVLPGIAALVDPLQEMKKGLAMPDLCANLGPSGVAATMEPLREMARRFAPIPGADLDHLLGVAARQQTFLGTAAFAEATRACKLAATLGSTVVEESAFQMQSRLPRAASADQVEEVRDEVATLRRQYLAVQYDLAEVKALLRQQKPPGPKSGTQPPPTPPQSLN